MKKTLRFILLAAASTFVAACGGPAANTGTNNANTNTTKPVAAAPTADALMALDKQANEAYVKGDSKFFEGIIFSVSMPNAYVRTHEQLLNYEGERPYRDVLLPGRDEAHRTLDSLKSFGEIQARDLLKENIVESLWELYAFSRVSDSTAITLAER